VSAKSRYLDQISPRREFHHAGMSITKISLGNRFLKLPQATILMQRGSKENG
jgi:hypothetical protein